MKRRPLAAAALVALIAACASPSHPPPSESTGSTAADLHLATLPFERATLLAADAATANDVSLRGADGLLAHFADDASLLLRRTSLIQGKPAIAAHFAQIPIAGTLGWRYARGDVSALGDFGYTLGWLDVIGPPDADGNATVLWSIYAAGWERRGDGEWRITAFAKIDLSGPPSAPPAGMLPLKSDGPVFPSFDGAAATAKKLVDTDTAFAALTQKIGQQKGFDAYVAEDAISINDPLILGRSAIFVANAGGVPGATLDWVPRSGRASRSGDLGLTIGGYTIGTPQPDGTVAKRFGKYLTIWRRQADGSFKWILDGGNSSPAPE